MRVDIAMQRSFAAGHSTGTVRSGKPRHAVRDTMSRLTNPTPLSRREAGADGRADAPAGAVHRLGRQIAVLALVTGFAYLAWRSVWSWHSSGTTIAWWLAVPALAVEVTGFVVVSVLFWALWRHPRMQPSSHHGTNNIEPDQLDEMMHPDFDVAIIATDGSVEDLRVTLVSLRFDPSTPRALVIDHAGRPETVLLAAEFDANYRVPDPTDVSGLSAAVAASQHAFFLLLNSGDIPAIGAAQSLREWMTTDDIAVVQGVVTATPGDSVEHGPNGRHDLTFERSGLNPGLGARGTGILTGSGALIRRAALRDIEFSQNSRQSALWEIMPLLAAHGARVVAAGGHAVVAAKPLTSAPAAALSRRSQADAGWRLFTGPNGALRSRGLRWRDRLALAAWAARSLDGLRRVVLGAIVLGALLAGRSPFAPSPGPILYLWAPAFVLASVALALLSGGTLRPGDRVRGSVRAVGLSIALVVAINSVLVIRGISDRFTHALHPLDHTTQIGLSVISLWLLAGSLDSLRLLARRRQNRRAIRLAASGTGRLDELGVYVSDITMLGAGLLSDQPVAIGGRHRLAFSVPSESGITSIEVSCVVRNARPDLVSTWRIGVEFEDVDTYALNTLAECCAVMPARAALAGAEPAPGVFDEPAAAHVAPRRLALQFATLLALAGVVSSAAPINAEASPPTTRLVSGEVVDVGEAPVLPQPTQTSTTPGTTGTKPSNTTVASPAPVSTATIATNPDPVSTDSPPLESAQPIDPIVTDPATSEVPPASEVAGGNNHSDLSGITVVGVCSSDAGNDGVFGTNDDTYGATVSTITDRRGSYNLTLDGLACWVSIEPPLQAIQASSTIAGPQVGRAALVDFTGTGRVAMAPVRITRTPLPSAGPAAAAKQTGAIGDLVWMDRNADGIRQRDEAGVAKATITLYSAMGKTVDTTVTGADGTFLFDRLGAGMYSLGVSNLPVGLRVPSVDPLTSRTPLVSLQPGQRLSAADVGVVPEAASALRPSTVVALPAPSSDQLDPAGRSGSSGLPTLLVILMAAMLGGSIVFASAQPIRGRRPTSR